MGHRCQSVAHACAWCLVAGNGELSGLGLLQRPITTTQPPWAAAACSAGQTTAIPLLFPCHISTEQPLHAFAQRDHYPRRLLPPHDTLSSLCSSLAMDDLREQVELLETTANLSTSISDIQKTIDLLTAARSRIAAGKLCAHCKPLSTDLISRRVDAQTAPLTLAKLHDPVKKTLDSAQKNLKPIYSGLNKYGKALDKVLALLGPLTLTTADSLYPEIQG